MTKYIECKGCKPHNKSSQHPDIKTVKCGYPPKIGTAICPCVNCLVKSMCMDDCDSFNYHKRTYMLLIQYGVNDEK